MNTKWIKEELNAYTNKSVNENDILIAYERIAYIFGLNSPSHIKLNNHFGIDLISKKYRLFSDTDTSLDEIYDDIEDMMIFLNISELNKKYIQLKIIQYCFQIVDQFLKKKMIFIPMNCSSMDGKNNSFAQKKIIIFSNVGLVSCLNLYLNGSLICDKNKTNLALFLFKIAQSCL